MRRLRFCIALLAAVTLAACGGGSGSSVDAALRPLVLASVQASTESAETAEMSFIIRVTMRGVPDEPDQSFEMGGEGAVDLANERARFVMHMPEELGDDQMPAGDLEFIVDGDTTYMRVPGGSADGKPWVRTETQGGFANGGGMGFAGFGTFDPNMGLDILGMGEPTNIETIGREEVRGESTIHYRVTAAPPEGGPGDDSGAAFLQMFAGAGPFVYDVWVDDDDRLRKMTFSIDLATMLRGMFEAFGAMAGEMAGDDAPDEFPSDMTMLMENEMEIWNFGKAVDIEIPPADQLSDHSIEDL